MILLSRNAIVKFCFSLTVGLTLLNNNTLYAQTIKILPLGNSITYGTNVLPDPDTPYHPAYRKKLHDLLELAAFSVDFIGSRSSGYQLFHDAQHCGLPGISDDDLVSILQTGYNPDPTYQNHETPGPYLNYFPPDIILLEIGTNDMIAGDVYDVSELTSIFNAIDAYETSSGKPVLVFVGKIINTKNGNGSCNDNALVNTYNANMTTIVNNRISEGDKLVLVDLQCGADMNYVFDMLDTYHPDESGYEKLGQAWFDAINDYNSSPVVGDIPNQEKAEGASFTGINLDSYVYDNEDGDESIIWTYSPSIPQHFDITINNRVATVVPKDPNWNGEETITFIATDRGRVIHGLKKSASNPATFKVTAVNDTPVIISQSIILSINEDSYLDLNTFHLNIEDVDSPPASLSLIIQPGDNYSFVGNRINSAANFYGDLEINVVVSDGFLQSEVFQVVVDVKSVNDPPSITLPLNRSAEENIAYSGVFQVNDIDSGDVLILLPQTIPTWLSFNTATLTLYGTPKLSNVGDHFIKMRVSDGIATVDSVFTISVTKSTGISDFEDEAVKVFPNPASDFFMVSCDNERIMEISLIDMNGRILIHQKNIPFQQEIRIETSGLQCGLYHCQLITASGVYAKIISIR